MAAEAFYCNKKGGVAPLKLEYLKMLSTEFSVDLKPTGYANAVHLYQVFRFRDASLLPASYRPRGPSKFVFRPLRGELGPSSQIGLYGA